MPEEKPSGSVNRNYLLKIALVAVPALITGWFQYRSSVLSNQQDDHHEAARAGYKVLKDAVVANQASVDVMKTDQAKLKDRMDDLEKQLVETRAACPKPIQRMPLIKISGAGVEPPPPPAMKPVLRPILPENLDAAWMLKRR